MRVPSYRPSDYFGALMDALDWRRIVIGMALVAWSFLVLSPVVEFVSKTTEKESYQRMTLIF